ncbi:MAG TPA: ATP-dependent DNA ligase [Myxococcaceae bacterium]|nr:ATP-dependent DNA ligase [Myxococcaceae bacterium]
MLLADVVQTSRALAATRSRLAKVALLAETLRRLPPEEIAIGVSWLVGSLRQGRIGIGGALLRDAMRDAPAAGAALLELREVDAAFSALASLAGAGSAMERRRSLSALLARATADEQDFLIRLVMGELRQGALEGLMVDALARASGASPSDVRRAIMVAGDPSAVAQALLAEGPGALARFRLQLLQPIQPMLAQTASDVAEALSDLHEAALEYKLDGARVQVHKEGDEVRVFTRSLREVTSTVPELVEAARALPARALILDGEAIAFRPDGAPQPFQITMRRLGRKLDVAVARGQLPLSTFFFDALHLDGEDLIARPGHERFAALESAVPSGLRIPRLVTGDRSRAEAFLADALRRGHEGVMVKSLAAPYEAGNRGSSWLKVKPAHTLDLVVLAAEWGHGRRRGWLSNLHLGARDPEQGGFAMLGKTFKGMTDEMLAWQTERLRALEISTDGYTVYVRPELVVEVAFDGLQASPRYSSKLALRFARVKRYRTDKRPEEADTIEIVRALYQKQLAAAAAEAEAEAQLDSIDPDRAAR